MKRLFFPLCLAFGLAAGAVPALAIAVGDMIEGPLRLQEKQIPLPRGRWTVVGFGSQEWKNEAIGAFGLIQSIILVQTSGQHVTAVAEINSNTIPVTDGWGLTASCEKAQQLLTVTRYRTGWELSCFFVDPTSLADDTGPATWQQARAQLAKSGLTLPALALSVGFRTSDRQDIVDLRLHFDPTSFPRISSKSAMSPEAWLPEAIKSDPMRMQAVEMLSAWALGVDGWIEVGLSNALSTDSIEGPVRSAVLTNVPLIDRKLLKIEQLYNSGVIESASLAAQEQTALNERPLVIEPSGGLSNSVRKNISFRVFGSFVDFLLAYFVTLSAPVSAGITASIVAIHSVIFVINDKFWEDYFAKQTTRDAKRIVDFTYIGKPVPRTGQPMLARTKSDEPPH
jgi:uncharacterized membrane protein